MIEVDPSSTSRAESFSLFASAPMPMLTAFKTIDITKVVKISKRRKIKLNAILCYAVYLAAKDIEEMHYLVREGKLYFSDKMSIGVVVRGSNGMLINCEIPATENFSIFYNDYNKTIEKAVLENKFESKEKRVSVGTSAILTGNIDGMINLYSPIYTNPFLIWSRYENKLFKKKLKVSFQFHHAQLDGREAVFFLENFQKNLFKIDNFCVKTCK